MTVRLILIVAVMLAAALIGTHAFAFLHGGAAKSAVCASANPDNCALLAMGTH